VLLFIACLFVCLSVCLFVLFYDLFILTSVSTVYRLSVCLLSVCLFVCCLFVLFYDLFILTFVSTVYRFTYIRGRRGRYRMVVRFKEN
jgi:hypothetical protein